MKLNQSDVTVKAVGNILWDVGSVLLETEESMDRKIKEETIQSHVQRHQCSYVD